MCTELVSDSEQFREMARQALELVERYYAQLPTIPVMPVTTARDVHELLNEPLPQYPGEATNLLTVTAVYLGVPVISREGRIRASAV